LSMHRPVRSSGLSSPVIVLWLTLTAIVGVVGCIVLARAQVVEPLPLRRALAMVLGAEVLLYLMVLIMGGPRMIPGRRVAIGIGLGLIIRAGLSLIAALLGLPLPATGGSLAADFGFYYAQFWIGALVQILAVSAFLWFVRDVWEIGETGAVEAFGERLESYETLDERRARREKLLAALMEGPEDEQLSLLREEVAAQPREPETAAEDTSQILAVAEEEETEATGATASEVLLVASRRHLSEAEQLLADVVGEGTVADTLSLPGGGGLVWAAPQAVVHSALVEPAGRLLDSVELLGRAVQSGTVQLVVMAGQDGCWALAPIQNAPSGWWMGLAQPTPVTVALAVANLRRVQAHWPAVELIGSRTGPPSEAEITGRMVEYRVSAAVDSLADQWNAQISSVSAEERTVILVGPSGINGETVAVAGVRIWHTATDLWQVLKWGEPTSVLVGLADGAVAVGPAAGMGQRPLLMVVNRDAPQIAGVALRLDRLCHQFVVEDSADSFRNSDSRA